MNYKADNQIVYEARAVYYGRAAGQRYCLEKEDTDSVLKVMWGGGNSGTDYL